VSELVVGVQGMTCQNCVRHATKALQAVDGVSEVEVTLEPPRATVRGEGLALPALAAALGEDGYTLVELGDDPEEPAPASPVAAAPAATGQLESGAEAALDAGGLTFDLRGMTCASCVSAVERALVGVPGAAKVEVSLPLHRLGVELGEGEERDAVAKAVARAVEAAGYQLTLREAGQGDLLEQERAAASRRADDLRAARWRAVTALILAAPLFVLGMGGMALGLELPVWTGWLQAVLATICMAVAWPIFRTAAVRLRHGGANMDSLVALGTLAAWGLSLDALLRDPGAMLHFEAAGVILAFVLLGRFLEARAQDRTGEALRGLLDLAPTTALRLDAAGEVHEIPASELRVGDRLRVLPGQSVPTDAVVIEGSSSLDESMLTGESAPVVRGPGDPVSGGTINGEAALDVEATRVGADTQLARIVRLVGQAQGSKAAVEGLADRISGVFVPIVLVLAMVTAAGWVASGAVPSAALLTAAAVLVVACPCALGLATPTAVVVAIGRAARDGLLIREARALERLEQVTHVVFDKTGTLTAGRFELVSCHPGAGVERERLLAVAAALESKSEHPLARGVVSAADGLELPSTSEVKVVVGGGVEGQLDGELTLVGSPAWLGRRGVAADPDWEAHLNDGTCVAVAAAGRPLGLLVLRDQPRPTARAAVQRLVDLGLIPVLLSGDRRAVAEQVAAELGIQEVLAEVDPAGKLIEIERLQSTGAKVAMVGDGLNDAPALAGAHVGIAMGGGTDVAKETAQVVVLGDDPLQVAAAVALARRTLRIIRQNLGWAFAYNVVALPLAMLGIVHAALAAAAMASSSVLVVGNSLRLRRA